MNFRRRLRTRHLQNRCSACRKVPASRFVDVAPERVWLCKNCFEEKSNGTTASVVFPRLIPGIAHALPRRSKNFRVWFPRGIQKRPSPVTQRN
jgi:hypothetical protein